MAIFERLLRHLAPKPGGAAQGAERPPRPESPLVAPASAADARRRAGCSAADSDDDDDDGDDLLGLPRASCGTLSAPLCAARRGALDMGSDSFSERGAARSSGAGGRSPSLGGSELDSLYSDVALIHRGRHAMIYRGRERRSRRRVVLKAYLRAQRNSTRAAALEREQDMLRAAAGHSGVVALERVLEAPDATYLVLEAGTGGTLIEAVANSGGRLPEEVAARRVVAPLLRALAHLHSRGIVHRDLKPEHILLAPDGPRIADFSVAAWLPSAPLMPPPVPEDVRRRSVELRRSIEAFHARHDRSSSGGSGGAAAREEAQQKPGAGGGAAPRRDVLNHRTGTLEYSAPEMLSKPTAAEVFHLVIGQGMDEEELPTYDEKVDVWAVGAVTFEALTGRQPFLADGAAEMAAVVAARLEAHDSASGVPAFIAGVKGLTDECRDFLARCFASAPAARPSAAELLEHPWLVRHTGKAGRSSAGTPTASPSVARMTRVMSDVPTRAGGLAELGAAAEPHSSDCGAHHATPAATLAPDLSRTRSLRRGVTASAADLDLTRPLRSATGRLEAPSRVAAAAAVGTAEA